MKGVPCELLHRTGVTPETATFNETFIGLSPGYVNFESQTGYEIATDGTYITTGSGAYEKLPLIRVYEKTPAADKPLYVSANDINDTTVTDWIIPVMTDKNTRYAESVKEGANVDEAARRSR